jgi:hypothetical protein
MASNKTDINLKEFLYFSIDKLTEICYTIKVIDRFCTHLGKVTFTQIAKNSELFCVIFLVMDWHMCMTKSMTCRKKPEISGFFAIQISDDFLKK